MVLRLKEVIQTRARDEGGKMDLFLPKITAIHFLEKVHQRSLNRSLSYKIIP
jgi:hypothetical protein